MYDKMFFFFLVFCFYNFLFCFVLCLMKSSGFSRMKIKKENRYQFFVVALETYKIVKFHFWLGTIHWRSIFRRRT